MRILSVALLAFLLQPVVPAPTPEPLVDSIVTPSIVLSGVALGVSCTNMLHNLGKAQVS